MKVSDLKKAYDLAAKDGLESFDFFGRELLTSYAKYLLEYLESEGAKTFSFKD